jgi:hypothetical protein
MPFNNNLNYRGERVSLELTTKMEISKRLIKTIQDMGLINLVLISVALISFLLLFSTIEYKLLDLFEWLFNLDWYWYGIIAIITAIRPVRYLLKRRGEKTPERKVKKVREK